MKKLLLVGALIASGVAARAATDEVVTCRRSAIAVALTPGAPATYTVSGELCATPSERHAGTTVQLLIHGATYNYEYWDFGRFDGRVFLCPERSGCGHPDIRFRPARFGQQFPPTQ